MVDIKEFYSKHKIKIILCFFVVLYLFGGVTTTVISKTAYEVQSPNKDGELQYFERPMFFNLLMFFGMFLSFLVYLCEKLFKRFMKWKKQRNTPVFGMDENQQLNQDDGKEEEENRPHMTWKQYLIVIVPSVCDFLATYFQNFGLVYVPSSVFQMMR